jgi:acyl-coenzyme A thioesterase PaaI-like protein
VKRVLLAVWDFIVGDDWVTAAGVVLAGAITAALESAGVAAWWLIPVAVVVLLTQSLARQRRRRGLTGAARVVAC